MSDAGALRLNQSVQPLEHRGSPLSTPWGPPQSVLRENPPRRPLKFFSAQTLSLNISVYSRPLISGHFTQFCPRALPERPPGHHHAYLNLGRLQLPRRGRTQRMWSMLCSFHGSRPRPRRRNQRKPGCLLPPRSGAQPDTVAANDAALTHDPDVQKLHHARPL